MKIGYPCINRSIGCSSSRTFRLKSYSEERLTQTIENNLNCLFRILKFNAENGILFFRISSDIIPFASHPINRFAWPEYFRDALEELGGFIKINQMRISMHPDQFNILNSPDEGVVQRTIAELAYHATLLDTMQLESDAKIQLHAGGVYGDKPKSMERFASRFEQLPQAIRDRLVIENDDRSYTLRDCLELHEMTGTPILFDSFHHRINSSGESVNHAIALISDTWKNTDGIPMVDYSSQAISARKGSHSESIDLADFREFLKETESHNFDIMLEIKDKEASALEAIRQLPDRFGPTDKKPRP